MRKRCEIDFVIPWVDGADPAWLEERARYSPARGSDAGTVRYRDWDNLVYWFRGVEKFAPWVNRVFLVTWGHVPKWLNQQHPKLQIVKHQDFIPAAYLPTFNASTISLNVHRIRDLSARFVYFNDDTFLIDRTSSYDFFRGGKPCDIASYSPLTADRQLITKMIYNNVSIVNEFHSKNLATVFRFDNLVRMNARQLLTSALLAPFGLISGFDNPHIPVSFEKRLFDEVWEKASDILDQSSKQRFRHPGGVNEWLMRYWYLAEGEYAPRSGRFGRYFEICDANTQMLRCIMNQRVKVVCCNDTDGVTNFERSRVELNGALQTILPSRSSFEA